MKSFIAYLIGIFFTLNAFGAEWAYGTSTDAMSGKTIHSSGIESTNSMSLGFPYKGANHGRLAVFQRETGEPSVLFAIEKGQLICASYTGCSVNVRFDESQPIRFDASETADHDSRYLFIKNGRRFTASASKAKRILVEVLVYQAGAQILEFNAKEPLNLTPPKKKTK